MIEKPLHIEPPRPPSIERRAVVVNYRFPQWRPLRFIIAAVVLLIALMDGVLDLPAPTRVT